jgi:hypothetical protein
MNVDNEGVRNGRNRRGSIFGLPTPLFVLIVLLSALTLYQQLMLPGILKTTQAELVNSVADRNQVATSSNTSVTQTQALARQLEALGYKPVVDRADIPKIVAIKPGPMGPQGLMGLMGPTGPMGPAGPTGQMGPQGIGGIQGIPGRTPPCVLQLGGCQGKDGKPGGDGKSGVDGKPGIDGKDGVDGKDGKDGVDGQSGVDGKPGVDGVDGKPGRGIVSGPTCMGEGPDSYWLTKYSDETEQRQDGPCRASTTPTPASVLGN